MGAAITEDKDITPALKNVIVLTWLQLIHPDLPHLVKMRDGAELQNKTLASLKTEIPQAMDSLRDELTVMEETRSMRIGHGKKFFTYKS